MTLPEYSITISPASMFLLQNRPRPWMGDLEKHQDGRVFERVQAQLRSTRLPTLQKTGYFVTRVTVASLLSSNATLTRATPDFSCPLLSTCLSYRQGPPARPQHFVRRVASEYTSWVGRRRREKPQTCFFPSVLQSDFIEVFQFSPSSVPEAEVPEQNPTCRHQLPPWRSSSSVGSAWASADPY